MASASAPPARAARPRVLVIAPHASYRTAPFIDAAHALEAEVLVASEGRHSVVSSYAEGLHLDLGDIEGALERILAEAGRRPFAGIVGTDDATTELAARAAAAHGLAHNPPEAVRFARRKDLARARLAQAGVCVPRHWRVDLASPLGPQAEVVQYPCVLKPIAMSASRGVIRADDAPQFLAACARIGRIVRDEPEPDARRYLLAEAFVPGFEVAVEGMLRAGRLEVLAIFDKPDPLDGPFFEETYYVMPSRLPAADQEALRESVARACAAYGLREGPVHAECRINERGVWVLEAAARTIGGLCARLLRVGTGYGLEEIVLAQAMGRSLARNAGEGAAGVLMLPIPRAGILRRVEGLAAASRVGYIEEVVIAVREGYELVPLPEGASYLGFIYARAPTPALAEAALREAHACLRVVVAPLLRPLLAGRD